MNTLTDIDKIWIIHYTKLLERKKHIAEVLEKLDITNEIIWVDVYDKEKLDNSMYENSNDMNTSEISCTSKHIYVYKKILETEEDVNSSGNHLVLEDDIILAPNFIELFNETMANKPDNWSMIFLGSGCEMRVHKDKLKQDQLLYEEEKTKCSDSYVINKDFISKFKDKIFKKFKKPIGWHLNNIKKEHKNDISYYWLEPPIVKQGSQSGNFNSSIQHNSRRNNVLEYYKKLF